MFVTFYVTHNKNNLWRIINCKIEKLKAHAISYNVFENWYSYSKPPYYSYEKLTQIDIVENWSVRNGDYLFNVFDKPGYEYSGISIYNPLYGNFICLYYSSNIEFHKIILLKKRIFLNNC